MSDWKEEARLLARQMADAPQILPEEIPEIELYMDQLTTYLDQRLGFFNRGEGEPFVTSAMVNNYSKAKLLPPSVHKRYQKNHVMLLVLVCELKRVFSIQELTKLVSSLTEEETEQLYRVFLSSQKEAFAEAPQNLERLTEELRPILGEDGERARAFLAVQLAARAQRDMLLAQRILNSMEPAVPVPPQKSRKRGKKE